MNPPAFTFDFVVHADEDGHRLDKLVAVHGQCSRRVARTFIATGSVSVNGRVLRILTRPLKAGARVGVRATAPSAAAQPQAPKPDRQSKVLRHAPIEVLHLDREVLAVNKPAGLLSEDDRFGSPSLQSLAPKMLRARHEKDQIWLVHRLDAGTSGVMILARSPLGARRLGDAFRLKHAKKRYLALCEGLLKKGTTVNAPLGRQAGTRHHVTPDGKPAMTKVTPVAWGANTTLVVAEPLTGRTHQIRVHLQHLGHPLLGDRLYGGPAFAARDASNRRDVAILRTMLHAHRLRVPHPKTSLPLTLEAPPPDDFSAMCALVGIVPNWG